MTSTHDAWIGTRPGDRMILTEAQCVAAGGHCYTRDHVDMTLLVIRTDERVRETCKHCGKRRVGTPQPAYDWQDA